MSRSQEFVHGCRDILPLILGAIPFGLIFGTLAVGAGLSGWQTMGMSALVFAGSAQFIAALIRGIVGIRLTIARIDAKAKMGQTRGTRDKSERVDVRKSEEAERAEEQEEEERVRAGAPLFVLGGALDGKGWVTAGGLRERACVVMCTWW